MAAIVPTGGVSYAEPGYLADWQLQYLNGLKGIKPGPDIPSVGQGLQTPTVNNPTLAATGPSTQTYASSNQGIGPQGPSIINQAASPIPGMLPLLSTAGASNATSTPGMTNWMPGAGPSTLGGMIPPSSGQALDPGVLSRLLGIGPFMLQPGMNTFSGGAPTSPLMSVLQPLFGQRRDDRMF